MAKRTSPTAVAHTNRLGDTYYLHEGRTKTGKPRYFFARDAAAAIATIPEGFEISESINGQVSIRRKRAPIDPIPDADVRAVETERARHVHLQHHKVRAADGEIVIYAPDTSPDVYRRHGGLFVSEQTMAELMARARYSPVMKFVRDGRGYVVHRMTYRGEGGWSWELASGPIAQLAKRFVKPIGTDDFFELM